MFRHEHVIFRPYVYKPQIVQCNFISLIIFHTLKNRVKNEEALHRVKDDSNKLIYLLNTRNIVLQKLTGSQVVKKFSAFNGTRRFITAFKRAHQLALF